MSMESAKQMVQGFVGALKGLRLYPLQHPAIGRQLQTFLDALLALSRGKEPVRMGVVEGALFIGEHLFTPDNPAAEDIARLLETLQWGGVEFYPGVTQEDLAGFLGLLHQGGLEGGTLGAQMSAARITHIRPLPLKTPEEVKTNPKPREIHGRALKVVDHIFQDVRLGKIPSSVEAMKVVKEMAEMTIADPHALFALSMLKDYDNYTFTHSVNVAVIALAVGRACDLTEEQLRILGLGGLLHDLGKLKVDVGIITKPGQLTEQEFEEIKKHPDTGADLVEQMEGVTSEVMDIVRGHHLRYDQSGYPVDMRGRRLSPLADMAAIADTYDALTTLRSYQRPMTPRKAIERLRELIATTLHPDFTERFIASLGTYPVGTLVRLDSNEIALVVRVGAQDPDAVQLKILFDENGQRLAEPIPLDLPGQAAGRIIAEVDPFSKGIDVTVFF